MTLERIHASEQLEEYLKLDAILLFKHSNTCPISATAYKQFIQFCDNNPGFPSVYIVVQEDRHLSAEIAAKYHIKHESPQAILFKNGDVAWHDSHMNITEAAITKALAEV